jgi:hypothetical protein
LHQNIAASLVTLIYVKVIVGACDAAVSAHILSPNVSRKIVHCPAGAWCLFWPVFNKDHWSWRLNVAIPAVYSVQLAVKGLILQDPNDADVKTMSRSGKPIELCQGPLLFTLVMLYAGLYEFRTTTGVYIMAAVGFGDGNAPLVGQRYPAGYYPTFPFGSNNTRKTLSDSAGMFLFTVLGVLVLRVGIGTPDTLDWSEVWGMATMATLAEAVSGKWDNPMIAITVWYFY